MENYEELNKNLFIFHSILRHTYATVHISLWHKIRYSLYRKKLISIVHGSLAKVQVESWNTFAHSKNPINPLFCMLSFLKPYDDKNILKKKNNSLN